MFAHKSCPRALPSSLALEPCLGGLALGALPWGLCPPVLLTHRHFKFFRPLFTSSLVSSWVGCKVPSALFHWLHLFARWIARLFTPCFLLAGWLMDWFLGWLIGWLIDWLTDGLTGSLMDLVCYFFPFFLFFAEVFNGGWVQLPDCCSLNGTDRVVAMAANIESQFLHVSCSSSFWDSLYRFCWDSWPDAPRSRHRLPFSGTCRDFLLGPGPSSAKDSDATKDSCQRFDAIDWYSPPGSIRNLLQGGNWVCVCVWGGARCHTFMRFGGIDGHRFRWWIQILLPGIGWRDSCWDFPRFSEIFWDTWTFFKILLSKSVRIPAEIPYPADFLPQIFERFFRILEDDSLRDFSFASSLKDSCLNGSTVSLALFKAHQDSCWILAGFPPPALDGVSDRHLPPDRWCLLSEGAW